MARLGTNSVRRSVGAGGRCAGRLQPADSADPREQLLQVPRTRCGRAEGGPAAGSARRGAAARRSRASRRSCPASRTQSELLKRVHVDRRRLRGCRRRRRRRHSPIRRKHLLARWIAEGAKYQTHWSFVAPKSPPLPVSAESRLGPRRTAIASSWPGWSARGLRRRPRPNRTTLIRRLTLDLTGLPPTLGRGRCVSGRRTARRLRAAGRSPAGLARITASGWRSTGSTRPASPTRTATTSTPAAT